MDKIEELVSKIKIEIQNEPCVKEYYRLKNIIKNDKDLSMLDNDIKKLQKQMCENRKNDEVILSLNKEYESKVKEFESNPLVINFKMCEEDVRNYLNEIKDVLEQK